MTSFPDAARVALGDSQLRHNLRNATTAIRDKRARVVAEVPDWEELREAGRAVKADVMHRLDELLLQFEASVQSAGGHVHWARDAAEANAVVLDVARSHGVSEVVKVKSLTTDEIELNDALAAGGVQAIETDFAELILQLDGDWSSHILVPAIHRNRTEIRDLFVRTIATGRDLSDDPTSWRRLHGCTCARSSSTRKWASAARTSVSPRPAPSSWSSPKGMGACARRSRPSW